MKCSSRCKKNNRSCRKKSCRYWIDWRQDLNCTFIAISNHGRMTLREIAERERLTFARIQQIEKSALKKLSKRSGNLKDFLIE
ncbi:MAG TPA: hypothetical protein EYN67_04030 [Flavobacteriales bacterium]|nr:hypothetical protein [Flavobacteriales bacterium]